MTRLLKAFFGLILVGLVHVLFAQSASIRITTFPQMSVADARSTITVSAEVRDSAGRTVQDGTQVVFATTLGSFREPVVTTYAGIARGILVAGGLPGTAHITVTAASYNATSTSDMEFLSDRSLLASAGEFVEIVSPGYLTMSMDSKIIGAADPNRGAHLRYREIEIDADDLQLDTQTNELRARKARLKFGKQPARDYEELYLQLPARKGVGTTTYSEATFSLVPSGASVVFRKGTRERFGYVQIRSGGIKPLDEVPNSSDFEFKNISESRSLISARKAVVFPRKEIQFQKAELLIDGQKTLKFQLFDVNLNGGTPILTDQIVNVNDNRVEVNYPHYLSLKPGQTSLLRFRTGQSYGRGVGASGGAFLDYELNWNHGDQMEGGLVFSGVGRRDYDVSLHQYLKFDDKTNAFAQIDTPGLNSVFGSVGINKQLTGFQLSLNGNSTRSLTGIPFSSQQATFTAEKDPIKVGKLPIQMFPGFTAFQNRSQTVVGVQNQSAVGFQLRNQLLPRIIDRSTTLNASLTLNELSGQNTQKGLTIQGSAYISKRLGTRSTVQMNYDYFEDPYSSSLLGHHRLTMVGNFAGGRSGINLMASRSLDADRFDYQADFNYRLNNTWRLTYRHTFDRFVGNSFFDYNAMLTYRYGMRDIGLTWSHLTHRFGIQILGASFN